MMNDLELLKHIFIHVAYLLASVLFVLGLKGLTSPETARRGMYMAEIGMLFAIVGTLLHHDVVDYQSVLIGLVIGSAIGVAIALLTPMTAMPERTAMSHACGALAVTLVGLAKYYQYGADLDAVKMFAVSFEVFFGGLTITGSIMAMGKLQGFIRGTPLTFPGQNFFNVSLFGVIFLMFLWMNFDPGNAPVFYTMAGLSLLFGVMLVLPIGSADMPVVISLLNSYAGLAACATGFALNNNILIIGGALDGASGFILSIIMCRAMNRSILNVLFGAFGEQPKEGSIPATTPTASEGPQQQTSASGQAYQSVTAEQAAALFRQAKSVIVVPGYGMAVSQAQHAVRELADFLKKQETKVRYAIHPVAGRMPGHMNVLLAEADVPYDELIDMDEINPEFPHADLAIVIGANDVTNPAARDNPNSPIYGMPILEVDLAKHVIVIKRSMNPGFAGIDNQLYYKPNTFMLFGDAKAAVQNVLKAFDSAPVAAPVLVKSSATAHPNVREVKTPDAMALFKQAKSVIIVPGYGMAVSQAQHGVREFADLLKKQGTHVLYAIHPVAGRMPGHMNVLLAEADVPYDELIDMDEINPEFPKADVALVIGANDVTNPAARDNPNSPIYGMPILEVDRAKHVIVIKRSMNPGFAGIDNLLYYKPNAFMLFGDAKKVMRDLSQSF